MDQSAPQKKSLLKAKEKIQDHGHKPYLEPNGGISIIYDQPILAKDPQASTPLPSPQASPKDPPTKALINTQETHTSDSPTITPSLSQTVAANQSHAKVTSPLGLGTFSLSSLVSATPCGTSSTLPNKNAIDTTPLVMTNESLIHAEKLTNNTIVTTTPNDESLEKRLDQLMSPEPALLDPMQTATEKDNPIEGFIIEEDDLLDEDDPFTLIDKEEAPPLTEEEMHSLIHSDEEEDYDEDLLSEGSYHSLKSLRTSTSNNSMVKKLGTMTVQALTTSTSGSSKRKIMEDEGDTATSVLMGNKKPRN